MSFKKEDLMLVVETSEQWFYADKGEKKGWVPHNYVSILEDIKSEKKQRKIMMQMKIILYHFQKGTKSKFSKKKWDGVLEE